MAQDSSVTASGMMESETVIAQAGAICVRRSRKGAITVLLVGSRRNGRWGLPKGHIDAGETTRVAAAREAFEEAGVRGNISAEVFGTFDYLKDSKPDRYRVSVYLLETKSVSGDYPEKLVRKKRWFPIEAAIREASQPGLRELLNKLDERQCT